jgi:cephalosporin hydroxylase
MPPMLPFKAPERYRAMEFRGLLLELIKLFEPTTYVEVGVQFGGTFNLISPHVNRAIAIDIIDRSNDILLNKGVECYWMSSKDFVNSMLASKATPRLSIDFLFIDANHEKSSVLSDFYSLSPFVKEDGLIFLHDTYPVCEELLNKNYSHNAWEAAKRIRFFNRRDFEIVTLPGPWAGLSIIRKTTPCRHGWMDNKL